MTSASSVVVSSKSSSRRRLTVPAYLPAESSPLNTSRLQGRCFSSDYATFNRPELKSEDLSLYWRLVLSPLLSLVIHRSPATTQLSKQPKKSILRWWKAITASFVCILIAWYQLIEDRGYSQSTRRLPVWTWDHNVYNPTNAAGRQQAQAIGSSVTREKARNLLLCQTGGSNKLNELALISGRPNRAYAKQWRRDFALYASRARTLTHECFDKTLVLNKVLSDQRQHTLDWLTTRTPRIPYDVIAILPSDAIVTDLDFDLLTLIPPDKLAVIAGLRRGPDHIVSGTGVMFFNLQHKYANAVAQLWWEMVEPPDVTCGDSNEFDMLITVVQSFMDKDEQLSSFVDFLEETETGFIGRDTRAIKSIPPPVPSSRAVMLASNLASVKASLHTVADSVCYRYYPKCEIL